MLGAGRRGYRRQGDAGVYSMASRLLADFKKLPKNAKLHPTDKTIQLDMMLGKAIVKWAC